MKKDGKQIHTIIKINVEIARFIRNAYQKGKSTAENEKKKIFNEMPKKIHRIKIKDNKNEKYNVPK